MRIVLIHGRGQGGKDPDLLRNTWVDSLAEGIGKARLPPLPADVEVVLPFYGDHLDELTAAPESIKMLARGPDDPSDRFVASFVLELAERAEVTDAEISAELGTQTETLDKGPENWPWVLAAGRVLSRKLPELGDYLLNRLTPDVASYLTRLDVRETVNELVAPHLMGGERCIVVSHSLGTIVAYWNLIERESSTDVPLLVTLGSPLGIDVVKANLPRPLRRPESGRRGVKAADVRDPVALFARLDRDSFPAMIENLSDVHNPREDPHGIVGYLSDAFVARNIAEAVAL